MKVATSALLALLPLAYGHYTFPNLILASNTSAEWQYIRMTANHYNSAPIDDPTSPAIRCYEDSSHQRAAVASVTAGQTLGFKASNTMGHPGPVLFYMARVPSGASAAEWKGDGRVWFKVHQRGATVDNTGVHFQTGMNTISFPVPRSLPAGEYLVRAEHIALHKPGSPQHYVACAQVKVTGGGSGRPGPLVAFPGAYSKSDPGIMFNMYGNPVKPYPLPGPEVWSG
ncbi:fungal cellulose binding domain-containing protein [Trichodelitschia bisporula]|uniref:lytic cellulose monooxygenase (C4-dehydrogenating) n=1 Tax=Trichodelitschia bisporula TaxID=703511 RepID=A0A6G1HJJ9_9PEZI|nr:fungal cellulose binding domain-containing protein [Trichodelitschia bisporula]